MKCVCLFIIINIRVLCRARIVPHARKIYKRLPHMRATCSRIIFYIYVCVCAVQIKYPFGYVYLYLYVYYWNSDLRSQVCFVEMVYICALIALAQSPHDVSHKLRAFISNMCVFNIYIKICFSSVYIHISCSILKQSVPCSELDQNIFHFAYI